MELRGSGEVRQMRTLRSHYWDIGFALVEATSTAPALLYNAAPVLCSARLCSSHAHLTDI